MAAREITLASHNYFAMALCHTTGARDGEGPEQP